MTLKCQKLSKLYKSKGLENRSTYIKMHAKSFLHLRFEWDS